MNEILQCPLFFLIVSKKVLEVMSRSSLVVLVDDPLISSQLGEFLNQVQSGLLQGSTSAAMQAPRASLLISNNDKKVDRYNNLVKLTLDYHFFE